MRSSESAVEPISKRWSDSGGRSGSDVMKPEILPEQRVSGRRLTPLRRLLYALLVPLALALLRGWWASCRVVRTVGGEHLDAALATAPSLLPCYWHQHELFCGRYLQQQIRRGFRM